MPSFMFSQFSHLVYVFMSCSSGSDLCQCFWIGIVPDREDGLCSVFWMCLRLDYSFWNSPNNETAFLSSSFWQVWITPTESAELECKRNYLNPTEKITLLSRWFHANQDSTRIFGKSAKANMYACAFFLLMYSYESKREQWWGMMKPYRESFPLQNFRTCKISLTWSSVIFSALGSGQSEFLIVHVLL